MKFLINYSILSLLMLMASCKSKTTKNSEVVLPPSIAKTDKQVVNDVPLSVPNLTQNDIYPIVYKIISAKELEVHLVDSFNKITSGFKDKNLELFHQSKITSNLLGKEVLVDLSAQYKLKFECRYLYKFDKVIFYKNESALKVEIPRAIRPSDFQSNNEDCRRFVMGRKLFSYGEVYPIDWDNQKMLDEIKLNFIHRAQAVYIDYLDKYVQNENTNLRLEITSDTIEIKDNYQYESTLLRYQSEATTLENMYPFGKRA